MTAKKKRVSKKLERTFQVKKPQGKPRPKTTLIQEQLADLKESKQLLEQARDFRMIVETAREGIWRINGESKTVFVNKRITEILGYTEEEIFQKKVTEFMFPEDVADHERLIKERKRGKAAHYERRFRHKDGSAIYTLVSAAPLLNAAGKYEGSFAVFTDITNRKRAEEELRIREAQFSLVFENSNDAIFWADCETGLLLRCNKAALVMFERSKKDLIGKPHTILHPPQKKQEYRQMFEQHVKDKKSRTREAEIITKTGKIKWVEISSTIIHLGQSCINQGIFHDITARKQREEMIQISEERYRSLFEKSRDALMTLSPPSWHFTSGNPAAISMFGVQNETDFLSRTPWEYSPPYQPDGCASKEKAKEMIEKVMCEGSHSFDWMHKRINGVEFPASVLLTRVEFGNRIFLQATVRDETEKKKMEGSLILEDRLANMGMLAAGVASEINNPLLQITSNVETLGKNLLKFDCSRCLHPAQMEEIMDSIQNALDGTHQIKVITRRLGSFLKVESGELTPVDLKVNIVRVISLVLTEIRNRARLVQDLQTVPPVLASDNKISQVFLNLLLNAVQSIEEGKPENNQITISTWSADASVFVEIKDTGVGISKENMEHIFELAFTTKGPTTGTGLGLPICQSIVAEFGGSIYVVSQVGKGSHFIVRLPVAP